MRSPTSCDTHDVRQGVVRRQVVGLSGRAVQCVRMGLRATGIFRYSDCIAGRLPYLLGSCSSDTTGESLYIMPVAGQLLDREGRAADSAGQTRSCPPQTAPAAGSGRPHDVRKGIIRRQGGRLPRCSIQRVRMGLRATGSPCLSLSCDLAPLATSCRICRARSGSVAVRGHLLRGKRRGPDSAGQTSLTAAMRYKTRRF